MLSRSSSVHSFIISFRRCSLHSHSVKLSLTFFCDSSPTVVILLNQAHFFQLFKAISSNLSRGFTEDVSHCTTSLLSTINLTECANSGATTNIKLPNHGCCSNVQPIWVLGWKLLVLARLHKVSPL